ncbi:PQ loop repeat protein [Entamoeba marina]
MLVLFLLFTSSFAGIEIPGCKDNDDGEFNDVSDFDFVPDMSVVATVIGILILLGTVLSVLPQYVKLIQKRDSSGLSPFYLLIQFINQVTAVANVCITNATYIHSCPYVGYSKCLPVLISWLQAVLLSCVYLPQIFFYLAFFPNRKDWSLFKLPLICTPFVVLFGAICYASVPLFEVFDGECGVGTSLFGNIYGIVATICVIIQWSPQIVMTFMRKGAGALSLVMFCITAPGMIILSLYMIFITKQSVSTWLSNAASAIQQTILWILLLYYEIVMKKIFKRDLEQERLDRLANQNKEKSPLLDSFNDEYEDNDISN